MEKIMVSICCTAYNHENYISDTIKSFLMQKTDFSFEILIHDDASTDGTAEIIKAYEQKYPTIIKPIYQIENQYSKGIDVTCDYLYSRAKGKYIALCEGDDYWIDSNKLQKQFNYMEKHPACSLCIHAAEVVSAANKKCISLVRPNNDDKLYAVDEVIVGDGGLFATNSMFFPTILTEKIPSFYIECAVGDYPLVIYLALKGEVFYMNEVMSAYRFMALNSWSSKVFNNIEKQVCLNQNLKEMLLKVDAYSNYIYTDVIKNVILRNQFNLMLVTGEFEKLKKGKYKILYLELNTKRKLIIFLKQYFPSIVNILKNIKRKVIDGL